MLPSPTDLSSPLWPVAIAVRPLRDWPTGPRFHWVILLQGGMVFHNTPELGEHLDTQWNALGKSRCLIRHIPWQMQHAAYIRLIDAIRHPRAYSAGNNCQHTVTRIVEGQAWSPTVQAVVITIGVGALAHLAYEADRAPARRVPRKRKRSARAA